MPIFSIVVSTARNSNPYNLVCQKRFSVVCVIVSGHHWFGHWHSDLYQLLCFSVTGKSSDLYQLLCFSVTGKSSDLKICLFCADADPLNSCLYCAGLRHIPEATQTKCLLNIVGWIGMEMRQALRRRLRRCQLLHLRQTAECALWHMFQTHS